MAERTLATPAKQWAAEYETIYILRPNVETEDAAKIASRIEEVMNRLDAKITKVETWGKRKLAYNIAKFTRGIFVYVRFVANNDVVAELERNLRLAEAVIRYQTIRVQGFVELADVEVNAEETAFEEIEQTEEEAELTTAEKLGMAEPKKAEPKAEEKAEGESAEGEKAEGETAEGETAEAEETEAAAEASTEEAGQ